MRYLLILFCLLPLSACADGLNTNQKGSIAPTSPEDCSAGSEFLYNPVTDTGKCVTGSTTPEG